MLTRLPLSLMVELAVDCSTKYSVPSALTNSGGGLSSAIDIPSREVVNKDYTFTEVTWSSHLVPGR